MASRSTIDHLIEQHIAAEMAGDSAGAVAVYTDVEHGVVGWPPSGVGRGGREELYDQSMAAFVNEEMAPVRTLYDEDFCVIS